MNPPVNLSLDVAQNLPAAIELSMHGVYTLVVVVCIAAFLYMLIQAVIDILREIDLKPVFLAVIAFALVGIYLKM